MAIIKPSLYISDMSGSADGGTMRRSKNRLTLARKSIPTNPKSSKQQTIRGNFTTMSKNWANLTPGERLAWATWAETQLGRSVLGEKAKISGYDAFMRCNLNLLKCGLDTITSPVSHDAFPVIKGIDVGMGVDQETHEVNAMRIGIDYTTPENAVTCHALVFATPIFSAGVTTPKNKFKFVSATPITFPTTGAAIEIDAFGAYVANIGSLDGFAGASNLKIALKVLLMWSDSGEQSGENIAEVLGDETP